MFGRSSRKTAAGRTQVRRVSTAPKELWAVVRELSAAEGLALVCLASWAQPRSGLVQASDRQVCSRAGVTREVMKRLRRKLAAMGIPVTPGNNLSHDSCSYDLAALLAPAPDEEEGAQTTAQHPTSVRAGNPEGQRPESAQPWPPDDVPYAYIGLSRERPGARDIVPLGPAGAIPGPRDIVPFGETGAIPQGELTSCQPTAPIWTGGPSIAIHLPAHGPNGLDTAWRHEVEAWRTHGRHEPAPPPPLPPYEQWLARR